MGMTLVEKVFASHLVDEPFEGAKVLALDLVMCQELEASVAAIDLQERGKDRVFDNTKIKAVIDHVTPSHDTKSATQAKIVREWARRHSIQDFFDVGNNGVAHALFPEKGFIRPGYVVIMPDSHTCTLGAFGAFAPGVGTTDFEVALLKGVCIFREPKTIRINVIGTMPQRVYAKDVILEIVRRLTVSGATGRVIEYRGEVIERMSMEERMTVCNMSVEAGATSGVCMPDSVTVEYLWFVIHNEYDGDKCKALDEFGKWSSDKDASYDQAMDIDVSDLEPLATVGYKPDQVRKVKELVGITIDQVYIGSCTNGRLSDLRVAASIVKGTNLARGVRGIVSPVTTQIYRQAMKEGLLDIFMDAGYCITNPTCGACLGMSNGVLAEGEVCAATTNRNFNGRMGKGGMVHLMSPASAAASGITGRITDPRTV